MARLGLELQKLVDKSQSAFIPGRLISDNILLAQHLTHGYGKARFSRAMMKVDIRKAYNSVSWKFLDGVLCCMEIPDTFVGWIMECIFLLPSSRSWLMEPQGFFFREMRAPTR